MQSAKDHREKYTVIKKKYKLMNPSSKPYKVQAEGRVRITSYEFQFMKGPGSYDELASPLTAADASNNNTSAAEGNFKLYKMKKKRRFFNAVSNEFEEGDDPEEYTQLSLSNLVKVNPSDIRCGSSKGITGTENEKVGANKRGNPYSQMNSKIEERYTWGKAEDFVEGSSPLLKETPNNSILVSFCRMRKGKPDGMLATPEGSQRMVNVVPKTHNFAVMQVNRMKQMTQGLKRTKSQEVSWAKDLLVTKAAKIPDKVQRSASSHGIESSAGRSQTGSRDRSSSKQNQLGVSARTSDDLWKGPWTEETTSSMKPQQYDLLVLNGQKRESLGTGSGSYQRLRLPHSSLSNRGESGKAEEKKLSNPTESSKGDGVPMQMQNTDTTKNPPVIRMLSSKHNIARLTVAGGELDFAGASIPLKDGTAGESVTISASVQQSGLHMRRQRSSQHVTAIRAYRTPGISKEKTPG